MMYGRSFTLLITDELTHMNHDIPTPADEQSYYVLYAPGCDYVAASGSKFTSDQQKAERFGSHYEAIDAAREPRLAKYQVRIEKLTVRQEPGKPTYTLTKADPFPEGHFYVVHHERDYEDRPSFLADTPTGRRFPYADIDDPRVVRFFSWHEAHAAAQQESDCGHFKMAVYRVDPGPVSPPTEVIVSCTAQ